MSIQPGDTLVDGTLGLGGHAFSLTRELGPSGRFVGIDADAGALVRAQKRLDGVLAQAAYVQGNFRDIAQMLHERGITQVNKILLDLGWGSHTLASGRGFSFQTDEPLVMTYASAPDQSTLTAADVVNTWSGETLETIIRHWGDEPHARKIAHAIVAAREEKPIETTRQLADIVSRVVRKVGKTHPATKTFQAIRIATNNELVILEETLPVCIDLLVPGGRLAVITFHSLEDRVVKHFFKRLVDDGRGELYSRKAIQPTREEILRNPKSRSAKLRIFIKRS
jgi:16S rRNA (cytosine1402-N4)-methyltransferase